MLRHHMGLECPRITRTGGALTDYRVLQKFLPYGASSILIASRFLEGYLDSRHIRDPRLDNLLLYCVIAIIESVLKTVQPGFKVQAMFTASVVLVQVLVLKIFDFHM